MNIKKYDLNYTVIKNRDDNELEDDEKTIDISDCLYDFWVKKNEISHKSVQAFYHYYIKRRNEDDLDSAIQKTTKRQKCRRGKLINNVIIYYPLRLD